MIKIYIKLYYYSSKSFLKTLLMIFLMFYLCVSCTTSHEASRPSNALHEQLDLNREFVITFPSWVSESQKKNQLLRSIKIYAKKKCGSLSYNVNDILSRAYKWPGTLANRIGANVKCLN